MWWNNEEIGDTKNHVRFHHSSPTINNVIVIRHYIYHLVNIYIYIYITWRFPEMVVPPKQPFWGIHIYGNPHIVAPHCVIMLRRAGPGRGSGSCQPVATRQSRPANLGVSQQRMCCLNLRRPVEKKAMFLPHWVVIIYNTRQYKILHFIVYSQRCYSTAVKLQEYPPKVDSDSIIKPLDLVNKTSSKGQDLTCFCGFGLAKVALITL